MSRKWTAIFSVAVVLFSLVLAIQPVKASGEIVYVVPLEKEVERGLASFLERAITEAEKAEADAIIFDINTPGGAVNAAEEIAETVSGTELNTVAFVNPNALSAGAFIALNADEIYMAESSKMGAAAIIDSAGNMANEKARSSWYATMTNAAETSGRDPIYAQAMVETSIDLPEVNAPEGQLLTLTQTQAEEVGYSEGTVADLEEVLANIGLEDAEIRSVEPSFTENIARFITSPMIVPLLLSIASLGFIIELFSPGFGIAGIMGLIAMMMFFFGHLIAGLAGLEVLLLFLIGIALIIAEFFVPGGILGILGLAAVVASILLSGNSIAYMGIALSIALLVAVIGMVIMVKFLGKNLDLLKRIILNDSTSTESGYVSNVNRHELIGKTGLTRTPLRPSGTIVIEDERIDAVTEGGYIDKEKQVKVVKVEGSRIVVREID
ncbi:nodulation protein NfeD [Jeotgalibacillus sp. S-D1]|uniref:NfeD family protein n=1 Tax=Jeotgalibacillus sp. S-D1 TaxID=2552189 RepID=UPI00105A0A2F|nr:nodulation protein NfeD [Jeotgalibacillus sp. S-D1]TDL34500.1 nodulation protein NfeD [Jeotgalibacillus sp. S-D1]